MNQKDWGFEVDRLKNLSCQTWQFRNVSADLQGS